MEEPVYADRSVLWIEEQYQEYDPILDDLRMLARRVVVARTEEGGCEFLRNEKFDLVILDLMLPKDENELENDLIRRGAGRRIIRQLRANSDWATSPDCMIVVFTARGNEEALNEIKELLGPTGHLIMKPFPVDEFVDVIRDLLEQCVRKLEDDRTQSE